MRDYLIKVDPFNFITLLDCKIEKGVNKHSTAEVVGYIDESLSEEYITLCSKDTWVDISIEDEDGKKENIFYGIIKNFSVSSQGDLYKLKLSLISGTYILDVVEHTRTFQDVNLLYEDLVQGLVNNYDNCKFKMELNSKAIGDIVVQYHETDWQFIKRLASQFNSILIPECTLGGIKFYFGVPLDGEQHEVGSAEYVVEKNIQDYISKSSNDLSDIYEADSISYIVESRELYKICDNVSFMGKKLYIYSINTILEGSEFVHKYSLKTINGFKINTFYNNKIIGASLAANIIAVEKDIVKVHAKVDESQDVNKAKWLPYSTVYSSPDGTGWYCMPEEGDEVRIYFPREKEKYGYVISAVHLDSSAQGGAQQGGVSGEAPRSNPDNKSLKSKYGKEVLFTPNSIKVTNNNGMEIEIVDDKGINIMSNKAISIQSDEVINIVSFKNNVGVVAAEKIDLVQGETKLTLENDITLYGSQVKIK